MFVMLVLVMTLLYFVHVYLMFCCKPRVTHGTGRILFKGMVSAETMVIVFVFQTTPTYSMMTNQQQKQQIKQQ